MMIIEEKKMVNFRAYFVIDLEWILSIFAIYKTCNKFIHMEPK